MVVREIGHLDVCHDPGEHCSDEASWCNDEDCEAYEAGLDFDMVYGDDEEERL